MPGLTDGEIRKVVNRYIGVEAGYLGDFSYQSHADFYPEYCDLDIDPYAYEGTTRWRFVAILSSQQPHDQARILRGVLKRFPPDEGPATRQGAHDEVVALIERLESGPLITPLIPRITSEVVLRALANAETLIASSGPTDAVDRVHTVLHGYLRAVCDDAGISYQPDDSMVSLFRSIQEQHPKLADLGPRSQDVKKVLNAFRSVLDAMLPVRNQASIAHPNTDLLDEPEARLIINASRTVLHYLDDKLS